MEKQDEFKVLWNSNATFAPTGYGTVTNNVVYRLLKQGVNVRVAANYGLEGAALGFNDLIQYPRLWGEFGEDALKLIIDNWKPTVLVTLYDIWIGARSHNLGTDWFSKLHPRWIPWIPVDHLPIPDAVADQARKAYKPVAMSLFGKKELEQIGLKPHYIPHGVETGVFKPEDETLAKQWLDKHSFPFDTRNQAKFDKDSFIVGLNAANKDPFRKDYARMFSAFQVFLEQNPDAKKDARFHVHSWVTFPGGFNLHHLAQKLEIAQYMKHTYQYDMFCSLPPDKLAHMYNALDVFINLARGEGFGVPIIEALSCGTPVIATDFTSMTELVKDHGWLVPPFAKNVECPDCKKQFSYFGGAHQFSHLMSLYAIPDEFKAAEALGKAYNSPKKLEKFSKVCRNFALGYDYDEKVLPLWLDLFGEVKSELGMYGTAKDKDALYDKIFKEATAKQNA